MLYAEASDATLYSADKMDSTSVERADIFWISCWDIYTRDVYNEERLCISQFLCIPTI